MHRPSDPSARPLRSAARNSDHRAGAFGRRQLRHRRARDHGSAALLAISGIPFEKTIEGRVGLVNGAFVVNPTYEQRKRSRLDSCPGRQPRRPGHGGGRGAGGHRGRGRAGPRRWPRRHQADCRRHRRFRARGRKSKRSVSKKEISRTFYREVEKRALVPLGEAMRIRGKLENYDRVDQVLDDLIASLPEGRSRARSSKRRESSRSSRKRSCARKCWTAVSASRRARLRRDSRHHVEVGVLPRTHGSALFTRGETQALVTARSAPRTTSRRSRPSTARPPSASCCTTTSRRSAWAKLGSCVERAARDRPRRSGRARAGRR